MGRYNSSVYRVRPVFDALRARDKTGKIWLASLLGLPHRDGRRVMAISPDQIGQIRDAAWDSKVPAEDGWTPCERALPAPQSLLLHLVMNTPEPTPKDAWGGGEIGAKRRRLHDGDAATTEEARALLMGGRTGSSEGKRWEVLEGPSCPDVYLETPSAIIVIEGKFTERSPTTKTKWMRTRSQMLRHIDSAWELRDGRDVYGFFIVEDDGLTGWDTACADTLAPDMVRMTLPHRDPATRAAICVAFLGITTWRQAVCDSLGLTSALLKSKVEIDAESSSGGERGHVARDSETRMGLRR